MVLFFYFFILVFFLIHQSFYIFGGDSGEFSVIASSWSISHPPGYPFYSLLINLLNFIIPFFSTSWKITLVSSISTVGTAYILFLLFRLLHVSKYSAIFASILYCILFPVWFYSEIPEVFALHNFIIISITYLLIRIISTKKTRYLLIIFFLLGLSFSHHHTVVLFFPFWIYIFLKSSVYKKIKHELKSKYVKFILAFLTGLSFYVYAIIASYFNPLLDWENAKTIPGLLRLFTRATYGTFKAYTGSEGTISNRFFSVFSGIFITVMDYRILGIICIFIGFIVLKRKYLLLFKALLIGIVSFFLFFFYSNFPLQTSFALAMYERFLIPFYLLLIIPLGFGIEYVKTYLERFIIKNIRNIYLLRIAIVCVYLFIPVFVFTLAHENYKSVSSIPKFKVFSEYAKDILKTPEKNSILFVGGDNNYFTVLYYRYIEKYRTDIKFIHLNLMHKPHYIERVKKEYPQVIFPFTKGHFDFVSFCKKNKRLGIYLDSPKQNGIWIPYGLIWKYYDSEKEILTQKTKILSDNNLIWSHYTFPRLTRYTRNILHAKVVEDHYIQSYLQYSQLLFAFKQTEDATKVMEKLVRYVDKTDIRLPLILSNLYIFQNDCVNARKSMNHFDFNIPKIYPKLAQSVLNYINTCDPDNEYKKNLELIKSESSTNSFIPISEF